SSRVGGKRKPGQGDRVARIVIVLRDVSADIGALRDLTEYWSREDGEGLAGLEGVDTADLPVVHPLGEMPCLAERRHIVGVIHDEAVADVEIRRTAIVLQEVERILRDQVAAGEDLP